MLGKGQAKHDPAGGGEGMGYNSSEVKARMCVNADGLGVEHGCVGPLFFAG